jgi:hypothetical protein
VFRTPGEIVEAHASLALHMKAENRETKDESRDRQKHEDDSPSAHRLRPRKRVCVRGRPHKHRVERYSRMKKNSFLVFLFLGSRQFPVEQSSSVICVIRVIREIRGYSVVEVVVFE